jgi:hypothetical protein
LVKPEIVVVLAAIAGSGGLYLQPSAAVRGLRTWVASSATVFDDV